MFFLLVFAHYFAILLCVEAGLLPGYFPGQSSQVDADQQSTKNATISSIVPRQDDQRYVFMHHVRPLRVVHLDLLTSDHLQIVGSE